MHPVLRLDVYLDKILTNKVRFLEVEVHQSSLSSYHKTDQLEVEVKTLEFGLKS